MREGGRSRISDRRPGVLKQTPWLAATVHGQSVQAEKHMKMFWMGS